MNENTFLGRTEHHPLLEWHPRKIFFEQKKSIQRLNQLNKYTKTKYSDVACH